MGGADIGSDRELTIAWLVQRRVAVSWHEAVALVLETAEVLGRSAPSSLPPYQDIAVTHDGTVRFLRTPTRAGNALTTLVDILRALLPTDSPTEIWDIASTAAPDSASHDTVEHLAAALRAQEPGEPTRRQILTELHRRTAVGLADEPRDRPTPTGPERDPAEEPRSSTRPRAPTRPPAPVDSKAHAPNALVLEPTLAEITDSLNAASACWQLSTEDTPRPYHRTVREVTKVELQRAIWLVEGLRLMTVRPTLKRANRNLGVILGRVFELTKSERRLNNVRLLANLSETSVMVSVDPRLAEVAYGAMLQAILAIVRQVPGAVVRCEVSTTTTSARVTLSQDSVPLPRPLVDRFFDESFHDRPGGSGTAVSLAASRRVVELHGGTTTIESQEPHGCRISAQLPLSPGRAEGG